MFRRVAALLSGVALILTGCGLVGTLVPLELGDRGASDLAVGLVGSAYYLGMLVGALTLDRVVQAVGHVRAFAAFGALLAASCLALGEVTAIASWATLRLLAGGCIVGLFLVAESWLAGESKAARGSLLAAYRALVGHGAGLVCPGPRRGAPRVRGATGRRSRRAGGAAAHERRGVLPPPGRARLTRCRWGAPR